MKHLTSTFFAILLTKVIIAQTLTKKHVDSWISATFPNVTIDDKVVYILNGRPIAIDSLSSKFSLYHTEDLIAINYIDKCVENDLILCKPSTGVIILQTKETQKSKHIRTGYRRILKQFRKTEPIIATDAQFSRQPVLIINGKQIGYDEAYKAIRRIKWNEIIALNAITNPVSEKMYGQNAINGLIIITTNNSKLPVLHLIINHMQF